MRRLLTLPLLIGALVLNGCAHQPLVASCITQEQLAELEAQEPEKVGPRLTGQADTDVKIVAGSALKVRGWAYNLRDALRVCAR